MAQGSYHKVIAYTADIKGVLSKLKQIEIAEKKVSQTAGKVSKATGVTGVKQIDKTSRSLVKLSGQYEHVRTELSNVSEVNRHYMNQLQGFGRVTNVVGQNIQSVSGNTETFGAVVQTADGKFVQLTQTIEKAPDGMERVSRSTKDVSSQFKKTSVESAKAQKNFVSMRQNIARLAKRAALTIPVWFALRGAITGVTSTISGGIKDIIEFDRILQKSRKNLEASAASPQELEANFSKLRKEMVRLSRETGVSVQDATAAFQKFATVGFEFEDSMKAANSAVKASVLLFGDSVEAANTFARTMRVLVDNSEGAASSGDQIKEAFALTQQLWKNNAFTLDEFTQSLEKFAPTANTANFTTEETISLLAALSTGAVRAGRGGRLLRTSIVRLVSDTDRLAETLGIQVNPAMDTTFDVFTRTLGALEKLRSETGKVTPEFERLVKEIFGRRSGDAVKALISLNKELKKNLEVRTDVNKFDKEFQEMNETINRLAERFTNLNKEIGRAFVEGLVGGKDFRDSLSEIVKIQEKMIDGAKDLGFAFNTIGKGIGGTVKTLRVLVGLGTGGISEVAATGVTRMSELAKEIDEVNKKLRESENAVAEFGVRMQKALSGDLGLNELERVIAEIETRLKLENIDPEIDRTMLQKTHDVLIKMLETEKEITEEKKNQIEQQNKVKQAYETTQDIAKLVIDNELERAKNLGASESELLKLESSYNKLYGIQEKDLDVLQRKLATEREIKEEKRLQSELGSQSLKLFRISQKEGTDVARRISDVLSGEVDFDIFERLGGKNLEVFKREFGDLFEQQQAIEFFTSAKGAGIDIEERQALKGFTPERARISLEMTSAQRELKKIEKARLKKEENNTNTLAENTQAIRANTGAMKTKIVEKNGVVTNVQPVASLSKGQVPVGNANITVNVNTQFGEMTIQGTREEVSQEIANHIEMKIRNIGTPGTPENKQLRKGLQGKQNTNSPL